MSVKKIVSPEFPQLMNIENLFKQKPDSEKILCLCKELYRMKKSEILQIIELMRDISLHNIVELIDFAADVKNVCLEFEEDMEKVLEVEKLEMDAIMYRVVQVYTKLREYSNPKRHLIVPLIKKMKLKLSEVCYKNKDLEMFIKDSKKIEQKNVIFKGLDFVYGVLRGMNGQKAVALMLTKILVHFWKGEGIDNNDLLMIEKGKKE